MPVRSVIGTHDLLVVTFDGLRFDVAAAALDAGRTPNLARVLPGGRWERRRAPATVAYAAYHALLAGCLPTPIEPDAAPAPFLARTPGCAPDTDADTWVFDAADLPGGLAREGYHTLCLGGVDAFAMTSPQGGVLPGMFAEAHWTRDFGPGNPRCFEAQLDRLKTLLPDEVPLFAFVNVAAVRGAAETMEAQVAALAYVDEHLPTLFELVTSRGRPCRAILCAPSGAALGGDDEHEALSLVPYAQLAALPQHSTSG